MIKPNLFNFATSELSQDAFLCWLLSWAKDSYATTHPHLHAVGKDFLSLIYDHAKAPIPSIFSDVDVRKQVEVGKKDGFIDILALINSNTAILIEDKAGTKYHSGQLARYKAYVTAEYPSFLIIPIYIQTGDQSDYSSVLKDGYSVLKRRHLLSILENANGMAAQLKSDILDDFSHRLRQIENDVQSFLILPSKAWSNAAWRGFYVELQDKLGDGEWDYVANPSGGFWGFWWHFTPKIDCKLYLQIEQKQLCFKVLVNNAINRSSIRSHYSNEVLKFAKGTHLKLKRPHRFGHGKYMTVAVLDQDFPVMDSTTGLLDMTQTLDVIKLAQTVIASV